LVIIRRKEEGKEGKIKIKLLSSPKKTKKFIGANP